jgi:hypothetical protein
LKRAKEVVNIIVAGPQCTPGHEEVPEAKMTDVEAHSGHKNVYILFKKEFNNVIKIVQKFSLLK